MGLKSFISIFNCLSHIKNDIKGQLSDKRKISLKQAVFGLKTVKEAMYDKVNRPAKQHYLSFSQLVIKFVKPNLSKTMSLSGAISHKHNQSNYSKTEDYLILNL